MKVFKGWRRRKCGEAVLASLAVYGISIATARSAEFDYGFGYVAERSDNIARARTDGREETTHSLIGGFGYRNIGPELATNAVVQAQSNRYQENTYEDRTLYFVDASALWTISPQLLTWTVEDRYTQAVRNVRAPRTPDNQEGANVFTTGPDVYLRAGAVNTLVLGGRYGQMDMEDSNTDSERVTSYSRWLYDANSTTTLSLNYEVLKVDFEHDTTTNVDYTRTDKFFRIDMRPLPSRYLVDVGRTEIERDRGPGGDGALTRLTWIRQMTSESTFILVGAREHEDAGTVLLSSVTRPSTGPTAPATPRAEDEVSADVFYLKRVEATYSNVGADWGFVLQGFKRSYDYQLTPQDRDERGWHVDLLHNPGGELATTLFATTQHTKFLDVVREDDDRTVGIRWRYRSSRTLNYVLEGSKIWRSSTDVNNEYTERRILLGAYWSTGPVYAPARQ